MGIYWNGRTGPLHLVPFCGPPASHRNSVAKFRMSSLGCNALLVIRQCYWQDFQRTLLISWPIWLLFWRPPWCLRDPPGLHTTAFRQQMAVFGNQDWLLSNGSLTKCFTAKSRVTPRCVLCLSPSHLTRDCPGNTLEERGLFERLRPIEAAVKSPCIPPRSSACNFSLMRFAKTLTKKAVFTGNVNAAMFVHIAITSTLVWSGPCYKEGQLSELGCRTLRLSYQSDASPYWGWTYIVKSCFQNLLITVYLFVARCVIYNQQWSKRIVIRGGDPRLILPGFWQRFCYLALGYQYISLVWWLLASSSCSLTPWAGKEFLSPSMGDMLSW